jgi:acetylornithine deacetylase/succinyl-diaminopimelate desuccinylase-like protein
MLLLAHIDVVEAKREDWTRDPFKLIEEDGYFYARGSMDDKAMAAVWVDTLLRIRAGDYKPSRTIKLALTCGEETSGAFNGAQYLSTEKRELIDAAFALNEGAWGNARPAGPARVVLGAGRREDNPELPAGGHQTRAGTARARSRTTRSITSPPGLTRISEHAFPIQFNDVSRAYFERMAAIVGGKDGAAMKDARRQPADAAAAAIVTADPTRNAMLRTTCVATMLDGGHATNALPQRAGANVNCRIFPGTPIEEVQKTLAKVIDDPAIRITIPEVRGPMAVAPPLTPAIHATDRATRREALPRRAGAADPAGRRHRWPVPRRRGHPHLRRDGHVHRADLGHAHGLNERIR